MIIQQGRGKAMAGLATLGTQLVNRITIPKDSAEQYHLSTLLNGSIFYF